MDDGASGPEESRALLGMLREQGVRELALTSHFYAFRESPERYTARRTKAFEELVRFPEAADMTFVPGAEILLCRELFDADNLDHLAYNGEAGGFALLELPWRQPVNEEVIGMVGRFAEKFSLRPVIAHINRTDLYENRRLRELFRGMGCLFQVNLEAFSQTFLRANPAEKLLRAGEIDFLASDCHNIYRRQPKIAQTLAELETEGFGPQLKEIYERSRAILYGEVSRSAEPDPSA